MPETLASVSLPRRITSIVLLFAGAFILYAVTLGLIATLLAAGKPDGMYWVLSTGTVILGFGLVWGGVTLWHRWRPSLGVILLLLGAFTIPKILGLRAGAAGAMDQQAAWFAIVAGGYTIVAVLLGLAGIGLLSIRSRPAVGRPKTAGRAKYPG